jgi:hypothetical protein
MEQFLIYSLVSFLKSLPENNPAYVDILKLVIGSTAWFGGLAGFVYYREKKLKSAVINK